MTKRYLALLVLSGFLATGGRLVAETGEKPFLDDNARAMDKMMRGMMVTPTGDTDRDFAAMMIPHHQGAIDMARAELQYGHNEYLRRIAQEIIVDQQQEIDAMQFILKGERPATAAQNHAQ